MHKTEHLRTPLPEWAKDRVLRGFPEGSQLLTKDGRRVGNAYLSSWEHRARWDLDLAVVATDAGNVMRLTHGELDELFHEPYYTMHPLPAHAAALEN